MKIFVAVPVYDGKLHIEFVRSLLNEQILSYLHGDEIAFKFLPGNAGITQARNQLATEFLESGFDRMVFLDADITFEPGSLVKLANSPADLVGGSYRYKLPKEEYPIRWLPDPEKKGLSWNEDKLIEVESIPTGFMAISKKVFEKFLETYPDRGKTMQSGVKAHCFFQMPYVEGALFGEDYFFCKEWRAMGGKVFIDPMIKLTHWSFLPTPYEGQIGSYLKNLNGIPLAS